MIKGAFKGDSEIDGLLQELLNLDLPSSRGTDSSERKLGGLGGAGTCRTSSSGVRLTIETGRVPASPAHASHLAPQALEDLERLGLEYLEESPARLGHSSSMDLLENTVLEEFGSPAKQAVRCLGDMCIKYTIINQSMFTLNLDIATASEISKY